MLSEEFKPKEYAVNGDFSPELKQKLSAAFIEADRMQHNIMYEQDPAVTATFDNDYRQRAWEVRVQHEGQDVGFVRMPYNPASWIYIGSARGAPAPGTT
ncbi:MAG TPA: hypothetical protein VL625_02690 [Patescibacteria group bacterium]|nr:hypothetical protein [Patescibacteria group bacterium]